MNNPYGEAKQAELLIQVMRQMPAVVTIVTATDGEATRGVTIGSFTSLSLNPPLISFNLMRESRMDELMGRAQHFVVNIPGPDQESLCRRFSEPDMEDGEQFLGVDHHHTADGVPRLAGAIAELHCRMEHRVDAGDHTIVIGRVVNVLRNREEPPLLYYNGSYRTLP